MKNTLIVLFFGAAVFVSGIFTAKPGVKSVGSIVSEKVFSKETEKQELMSEVNKLILKNAETIDSLKNTRR